ncbi:MAG: aromatic ring-hydroxylating dioxygenase subunit alpha [Rhodospirillales bacterium]|nr:aromatic ring-hydroxylating dioxygenase subunit alpha [Rhodospirillales bacterium]
MLPPEKNRLLTEVGPGTPMGDLLRRYWHPIAGVTEFEAKAVKPIRLFGENLVLFKTLAGDFGLIARRCAHRGSDLSFGIVEEDGLRCGYHGWQYDRTGACVFRPFENAVNPGQAIPPSTKLAGYPVQVKGGMIWTYMGPQPAPLLPDWETFSWPNCYTQVVIAEIPCNWLQCQENTVDPVHFEWMHNNGPQRRAGDFGPYSPPTIDLQVEDFEYGLISRRFREGTDKTTPLWSVGRAILWPNGWYFGHHFEWKVPIDDENTLFITWSILHVPTECEPYVQTRIPTWYAPIKDENGEWILSHVGNQDIVAWVSQGRIADRTHEHLGASDRGVAMLRRRLFDDLAAVAAGREPRGIIRNPERNVRIELPCIAREDLKNGLPRAEMQRHPVMGPFLRDYYSMAGQPEEIKEEFEQAMSVRQSTFLRHKFVPQ